MKKLLMLIITTTIMTIIGISGGNIAKTTKLHEIYIPTNSCLIESNNYDIIHTGSFDILRMDDANYDQMNSKIEHRYGESVKFSGSKSDANRVLKDLDVAIVDKTKLDDKTIVYGYSHKLTNYVIHEGKRVNIELIYGNNEIEIGTPLIMGSY